MKQCQNMLVLTRDKMLLIYVLIFLKESCCYGIKLIAS